ERLALLDWIHTGAKKEPYESDDYTIQDPKIAAHSITPQFAVGGDAVEPARAQRVKIKTILQERCVSCPITEGSRDTNASPFPLDSLERLKPYLQVQTSGGMSLTKLAQTTHVHLLGFSMLYGLTGLIFAFTSYPGWVRAIFGPFTLVAQLV